MSSISSQPELWDEDGHSVTIVRKLLAEDLSVFDAEAGPIFVRVVESANPDLGGEQGLPALEAMEPHDMLEYILSFQLALGHGRQFEAVLYRSDEDERILWSGLLIYSSSSAWVGDDETDYDDLTLAELFREGLELAKAPEPDEQDEDE